MRIAFLGAGRVGSTLGRALAEAGHEILYGRRQPEEAPPDRLVHPGASTGSLVQVVRDAELVFLTTPWGVTEGVLSQIEDFEGKVLVDVTNPIGPGLKLTHGHTDSGAEQVQRWAPTARVVKAFHSTGVENMANPRYDGSAALMLVCGADEAAVDVTVALATELGFDALPFGPLDNARLLEPMAMVWIQLALVRGHGRDIALGLLRRTPSP